MVVSALLPRQFFVSWPHGDTGVLDFLNLMEAVVGRSAVPLAPDKMESPTSVVTFLGIVINLVQMECRLQDD